MSLYFWVMVFTLSGPLLLSFDKKIHFYTYWKAFFPAILIVAIPFIIWDQIFTVWGLWGFNMEHLNGFFIGDLPIEEICFFLFVPFACLFIYEVLNGYFSLQPSKKFGQLSAVSLTIVMLVFGSIYYDRLYTSVSCFLGAILTILFYFVLRKDWYGKFVVTFLVVQLPFFVVNGILTGTMIESPIVWYNSLEMSNFRLGTIPFEDIFYNYGMLLLTFSVYIRFKKRQGLPL